MNLERFINEDPWVNLRKYTKARIALGRAGTALTTAELLRFRLDHARARDAVVKDLDLEAVRTSLGKYALPIVEVTTQARDRNEYLRRPDLGRRLSRESGELLQRSRGDHDISLIAADGLSSQAIETNLVPFLDVLLPQLGAGRYLLAPFCLVQQGRVAVGDEIGSMVNAKMTVVMIGERPGLSSPDSMGIYITYGPAPGLTDERRNCISNVRAAGLSYSAAAFKLLYIIREAIRLKLSGVQLKDSEDIRQVRSVT